MSAYPLESAEQARHHLLAATDHEAVKAAVDLLGLSHDYNDDTRCLWRLWHRRYSAAIARGSVPLPPMTSFHLQVYFGLGRTFSVPCVFWSQPHEFLAAAGSLSRIRKPDQPSDTYDEILDCTAQLRAHIRNEALWGLGWAPIWGLNEGGLPMRFGLLG